jgi:anti-sigma-K factor RskA
MTIDKNTFDELLPFYALDAVSDDERAAVEAYLAAHPAAQAEVNALRATVAQLPALSDPVMPDPEVKRALMARVEADAAAKAGASRAAPSPAKKQAAAPAPKRSFWDWFWPGLALGATAAALMAVIWGGRLLDRTNDLSSQVAGLQESAASMQAELEALQGRLAEAEQVATGAQAQLSEAQTENATLREQLQQQQDVLASYQAPGTVTMAVGDATGENPLAAGTLILTADGPACFTAANLLPLAADQTYQLWLIDGQTPIDAGTFLVDETGAGTLTVARLPDSFDAIGVSIEPAGGSETPTVDQIILLGAPGS